MVLSVRHPGLKPIYFPEKHFSKFTVKIKGKARFYILNLFLCIIINSLTENYNHRKVYQKAIE